MKKLSIKQRLTLFYAAAMLLIGILIMSLFYLTLDTQITHVSHTALEKAVKGSFDLIEAPGNWLEVSNQFDFYVQDVSLVLYGPEGTRMLGQLPAGFPEQLPLQSDVHQSLTGDGENWQVYDLYQEYPNGSAIWVRGVYSLSNSMQTLNRVLLAMLIAIPLLIFISLGLGYWLTRRAFEPIAKIQATAEQIRRDRDLTRRINLHGNENDELYRLGQTFDEMFGQIEQMFQNEAQFSSDASHELRTPVSVILSQAEYGLANSDDPAACRESLQSILNQSRHMAELVSQLLELSRLGNTLQQLNKEPINLAELCEIVTEELADLANEHQIQLITKLDRTILLNADQTQIMRVVINLVTNAINYGRNGGFVMIDLHRENKAIVLTVSDNGIGIPPEHIDKIFNRFYQVDAARSRCCSPSTGLGLTMVKQIVEAHQGQITIQSTEGVGSSMVIRFPSAPAAV